MGKAPALPALCPSHPSKTPIKLVIPSHAMPIRQAGEESFIIKEIIYIIFLFISVPFHFFLLFIFNFIRIFVSIQTQTIKL